MIGDAEVYNDEYTSEANLVIDRSYSASTVIAVNGQVGGLIGDMDDIEYPLESVAISNSFVAGLVGTVDGSAYAVVGGDGYNEDDGSFTLFNVYFDETVTNQSYPTYHDEITGWTATNSDGDQAEYFKNNSVNEPLDAWDFEDVWLTQANGYPLLRAAPLSSDADSDGIANGVENAGPNSGDANNDGVSDGEQANVASMVDPVSNNYAVLMVNDECTIQSLSIAAESANSTADTDFSYPAGMMDFVLDCGDAGATADVTQYYYGISGHFDVRKFNGENYQTITDATTSDQTIDAQQVKMATYQVVDGGSLDLDDTDGIIRDPAGIAQTASAGSTISGALTNTGQPITVLIVAATTLIALGATTRLSKLTRRRALAKN